MAQTDRTVLRIMDANLNRAREALRVLEEYSRFALDDALLTEAFKAARHKLVRAVPSEIRVKLTVCRDIVADVGRDATTISETQRSGTEDVVDAASSRLTEALRAIEEYGKIVSPEFGAAIEKLRYEAYELHRRLDTTMRARLRFSSVRLYVLLTESLCRGAWFETAEAVLRGGADCIQLREKDLTDRELCERAARLAALCHQHDTLFIVNDRADVAAAAGADGVHLGQDDLAVAHARRILPPSSIIGVSTHHETQVRHAAEQAPDYIAVGPIFASATKPRDRIAGPKMLRVARGLTAIPLVAIGGIDAEGAAAIQHAAPCTVCVCSAIISQPDPESAAMVVRRAMVSAAGAGVSGVDMNA